ncbi:MAG TPA: FapA family protein, partial [Bacillales bacterium]
MQSIVSKGKGVREAIQIGLDLLNVKKDEVDIEIIRQESKGFLGIGGKNAVVKISKTLPETRKTKDPFESVERAIENLDVGQTPITRSEKSPKPSVQDQKKGRAWVQDGKLYYQSSADQYPTVSFNKDVQLFKNRQPVQANPVILSEKDDFEIQAVSEKKETSWTIEVDSSKLSVTLKVDPGYEITRKILDAEADTNIEVKTSEQKETVNSLTYEEVIQRLKELRVIQGFHHNEIMKALEIQETGTLEIARGVPAKPGKDGWLEKLVEVDTKRGLKEDGTGKVDFRESRTIPTVGKGKVIAVVHPPVLGQPGITVTNEPLPAKRTVPIVLRTGKGVMTVENKVVATESGRPLIEQRGTNVKVSIMPKLIHRGDVDLASGNIRFNGDVEVFGDIKNGMAVEAGGDITVYSTVNFATLTTSGAIVTRSNVIGSELSAGKNNMLVAELGHMLGILSQQIDKMDQFIKQLSQSSAFKNKDTLTNGLQPLIKILLEKKFNGFTPLAKQYVEVTNKSKEYLDREEWKEIAISLQRVFLSLTNDVISHKGIEALSMKM